MSTTLSEIHRTAIDHEVSTVQSYTYNGKTVQIDLRNAPEFSTTSLKIFEHLKVQLPESFQTAAPLKDRLHTLKKTSKSLKKIEDKHLQNKLLALIEGVGAILSIPLGVFGILSPSSSSERETTETSYAGPGLILIGLSLASIAWKQWNQESTLRLKLAEQIESIQKELSDCQKHNNRILSQAQQFYTEEASQKLNALIDTKIQEARELLLELDHPVPNPRRQEEITTYIKDCVQAKSELQKITDFYNSFRA
jgi:hypothetical protein